VTHAPLVADYADRTVRLVDGRLTEEGGVGGRASQGDGADRPLSEGDG